MMFKGMFYLVYNVSSETEIDHREAEFLAISTDAFPLLSHLLRERYMRIVVLTHSFQSAR